MEMNMQQVADTIADAIASRPVIPADRRLWDSEACAEYLGVTRRAFNERWAPLPSFPEPARIQLADGKMARPRWKAAEVMAWVERQMKRPPNSRQLPRK